MFKFLLSLVLIANSAFAVDFNESACNGKRLVSMIGGPKPVIDKFHSPFSNPTYEKICYSYADNLIRNATDHDHNLDEVEGVLETMVSVNPESAYQHMISAELAIKKREFHMSSDTLYQIYHNAKIATEINPGLSESFITLGRVGLYFNCIACAEIAIKKAKGLGNSSLDLTMLESSIAEKKGNIAEAITELSKLLSNNPSSLKTVARTEPLLRLAFLNAKEKRYVDAQKNLSDAIEIIPENPTPYIAQAELLLFWVGDSEAAAKAAVKANQVMPTIEAKRVQSISEYLTWAKAYLNGHKSKDIKRIIQASFLTPEEVFVFSARYSVLSNIPEALIKAKIIRNIEVKDGEGSTALISASVGNNINLAKMLIKRNANVNAQNGNGERPLSYFVLNGNKDASMMILKAGAQVNYIDVEGISPLSLALFRQDKVIVNQLMDRGASTQPVVELAQKLKINDIEVMKLIQSMRPASVQL